MIVYVLPECNDRMLGIMGPLWCVKKGCLRIGRDHCLCHPKIVEQKARDSGGIMVELTSLRWNRRFMTVCGIPNGMTEFPG